jgi:hypothetical protein
MELIINFLAKKKKIVAKGFNIAFDELTINNEDSLRHNDIMLSAINKYPIDIIKITQPLKKFQLKEIEFKYDTLALPRIRMVDNDNCPHDGRIILQFDGNDKIIREIWYFNGRDY